MDAHQSDVVCKGEVEIVINYLDGKKEERLVKNTVLKNGRANLIKVLTSSSTSSLSYFIKNMIFGNGGTDSGNLRYVSADRTALFSLIPTPAGSVKPVISSVSGETPTQGVFTSVMTYDDCNGYAVNEMALVMEDGTLYSMVTFGDLTKTNLMQITFNWRINML
jgi:hypothetical protein